MPPRQIQSASPIVTRNVRDLPRLFLFVRAGGRCEFDGCNEYLMEDGLTLREGNFAEMAHVVAFRERGPRGNEGQRPADINGVDNLMLLCPTHHKLIDDHPSEYTREGLEKYKRTHEDRVLYLTGLAANERTAPLILRARILGDTVTIPFRDIVAATAPRYPLSRNPTEIDLTNVPTDSAEHLKTACDVISQKVAYLFSDQGEAVKTGHISLFALGPIPLLIYLGRQLTNKVPIDLYQRHRDDERWTWKIAGPELSYRVGLVKRGDMKQVAVVISVSGSIGLKDLPTDITNSATVYELTISNQVPSPTVLKTRKDLEGFRVAYQELLGLIAQQHGHLDAVDLFPAVPAPVAVLCGRELLPKVHPQLRVFDFNKANKGFTYQLTV